MLMPFPVDLRCYDACVFSFNVGNHVGLGNETGHQSGADDGLEDLISLL